MTSIPAVMLGEEQDQACYRVIVPAHAGNPQSGMGAARRGGRFNRPGQEALYLSLLRVYDPDGALQEIAALRPPAQKNWQGN
ncbi:MAG: hypothetical protein LBV49_11825 [Azonexus sp.]|jgi:RES domain-containing protein|nr:hypothetical protein [Azonexus sp.]